MTNKELQIKEYVRKYARDNKISEELAMTHKMVQNAIAYIKEKPEKETEIVLDEEVDREDKCC